MPLDPLVVIDVVPFTLAELAAMHNPAPPARLDGDDNVQTLVVDNPGHRIERAVLGVVTPTDTYQMEIFPRNRVFADRMEAEPADAVAPGNAARQRPVKISLVDGGQDLRKVVVIAQRTNRGNTALAFDRLFAAVNQDLVHHRPEPSHKILRDGLVLRRLAADGMLGPFRSQLARRCEIRGLHVFGENNLRVPEKEHALAADALLQKRAVVETNEPVGRAVRRNAGITRGLRIGLGRTEKVHLEIEQAHQRITPSKAFIAKSPPKKDSGSMSGE